MEFVTSWEEKGRVKGRTEGARAVVMRLAVKKFGTVSEPQQLAIGALTVEQLEELNVAIIDFAVPTDLDRWLLEPPVVARNKRTAH